MRPEALVTEVSLGDYLAEQEAQHLWGKTTKRGDGKEGGQSKERAGVDHRTSWAMVSSHGTHDGNPLRDLSL